MMLNSISSIIKFRNLRIKYNKFIFIIHLINELIKDKGKISNDNNKIIKSKILENSFIKKYIFNKIRENKIHINSDFKSILSLLYQKPLNKKNFNIKNFYTFKKKKINKYKINLKNRKSKKFSKQNIKLNKINHNLSVIKNKNLLYKGNRNQGKSKKAFKNRYFRIKSLYNKSTIRLKSYIKYKKIIKEKKLTSNWIKERFNLLNKLIYINKQNLNINSSNKKINSLKLKIRIRYKRKNKLGINKINKYNKFINNLNITNNNTNLVNLYKSSSNLMIKKVKFISNLYNLYKNKITLKTKLNLINKEFVSFINQANNYENTNIIKNNVILEIKHLYLYLKYINKDIYLKNNLLYLGMKNLKFIKYSNNKNLSIKLIKSIPIYKLNTKLLNYKNNIINKIITKENIILKDNLLNSINTYKNSFYDINSDLLKNILSIVNIKYGNIKVKSKINDELFKEEYIYKLLYSMINLYFLKKKYRINKNIYEKLTNRIEREEIEDIITENLLNPEIDNNSQTAIVNIYCTYNNTIITITDINNNTLSWSSSGAVGFPGTRRQTPYAAQTATIECVKKCQKKNPELKEVFVRLKGFGKGRSAVIKGLEISGLKILEIKDITPVPHNGCRPKKKRRV